ncbi:TetR/AcrR family transcriptional regulator [Oscillatoria laete-virens NRMC-F 0139]|nr:TetR/AcrR family transcriptional regulator [Oscillatoria laete-virens]MDL5054611.1 TetR/AcrR family transcriptional regulator [Oscillatoria laete-virens NRMC-F 0139]
MTVIETENRYHHGDLKNALIDGALQMLAEDGVRGLSLRKVARHIGVSHNAPYQHFADKEALIAALAERGFRQLDEAIQQGVTSMGEADPVARLVKAGMCYVEFMSTHAEYHEVMFGSFPHRDYPSLAEQALASFNHLVRLVEDGQAAGVFRDGDPREIAAILWAAVHGLSAIFASQKMPPQITGSRSASELTAHFIHMTLEGVLKPVSSG